MDYRIERGRIDGMQEALLPLLAEHRDELTTHKHIMALKPDWERYLALDAVGALLLLYAYSGNRLVGYSCTVMNSHLHYADLRYAHNDVLYVARGHRKGKLGLSLIRMTEQAVAEAGGRFIVWHAKPCTPLAEILPRIGYDVQDILYSKEL